MENFQDQPLPPGVQFLPNYSLNSAQTLQYPNAPPYYDIQQGTLTLITPEAINSTSSNTTSTECSVVQFNNARDIDAAAQDAVLREQELATQNIIRSQREVETVASLTKDNLDLFSERRDPNALKEHLLKMATEHRTEMAVKRGKTARSEGNTEIGNGYGVPGGGAYNDVPKLNTTSGNNAFGQPESKIDSCPEEKPAAKELPEYLKQKLRARGILKDDRHTEDLKGTSAELRGNEELPPGWVESKDPGSGAFYYYNESTGKSQWEKPCETSLTEQSPPSLRLPENWVEALDETSGHKYYYNTKTHVSQWKHPNSSQEVVSDRLVLPVGHVEDQSSNLQKCMGCGGWGVGLVQAWGYCNHCTRALNLPQCQYLVSSINNQQSNAAHPSQSSDKMASKQRYGFCMKIFSAVKLFRKTVTVLIVTNLPSLGA